MEKVVMIAVTLISLTSTVARADEVKIVTRIPAARADLSQALVNARLEQDRSRDEADTKIEKISAPAEVEKRPFFIELGDE